MSDVSETIEAVRSDLAYCPKYSPAGHCFYLPYHAFSRFRGVFDQVKARDPSLTHSPGVSLDDLPEGVIFGFCDKDKDAKLATWLSVGPYVPQTVVQKIHEHVLSEGPSPPETEEFRRRDIKSDRQLGINRKGRPAKYPFNQMKFVGDAFLAKGGKLANVRAAGYQYLRLYQLSDEWRFKYFEHPEGVLVLLFTTDENKAFVEIDGSDGSGD